ncbi:MAG TPA: hypothetical protein PKL17_15185 [Pseudomonadota bacterium]|nr:hypothetical protein [Pseudomonadota bacterium]
MPAFFSSSRRTHGIHCGLIAAFHLGFFLVVQPVAGASEPPSQPGLPSLSPTVGHPSQADPATDAEFVRAVSTPGDEPSGGVRRHYMWSNERKHDIYFEDFKGLGGGYLGVGGDQNYTMAAAAGSQVLWLVDIDLEVVKLHKLYSALLRATDTPQAFVALFERKGVPLVDAALAATEPRLRKQLLVLYTQYREDLLAHLRDEISQSHTWLGDAEKYNYIRKMAQKGLIVPRLGDLNGPRTMMQIADAAKAAKVTIRVVYLSNAESWFSYGVGFRRNFAALPLDEQSCVVRTIKSNLLPYVRGDVWHYTMQRGTHFVRKLSESGYSSIDQVMLDAVEAKQKGLSHVGVVPPAQPPADPSAAAKWRFSERQRRQKLLADGLVTRPAGNRECASEFDQDRKQKAEQDLKALDKRIQTTQP